MARTILIVETEQTELEALVRILGRDYRCLPAADGCEALAVLRGGDGSISAVLVDMETVTDGETLTGEMRKDEYLAQIPIFAAVRGGDREARTRALTAGAAAVLEKPLDPEQLLLLLQSILRLCESADDSLRQWFDPLTGLYSRDAFFKKAEQLIKSQAPGYYTMTCFNIDNFKVINDQYGIEKGDEVLRHVGSCFKKCVTPRGGICCRYTADKFAALYPAIYADSEEVQICHRDAEAPACINRRIRIRIGRCLVDDPGIPVGSLYDRAAMAEGSIRGRYDVYVADYQESMRERLLQEQQIVSEMYDALAAGEFEPWFQPQYNHATGALIGAEALVRWRRADTGELIPPGRFIPAFERNGFVYELDKYIWEQVCRILRKWLDAGRSPLPVSVNVSRYDVLAPDFFPVLTELVRQYDVPIDLLRLEITESAFSQSPDLIVSVIKQLAAFGFTVEIDDFGSGYSSLNTLKDVPAHILKLDMKFLDNKEASKRGGNILESVVRMAKWLDMAVIAEGVETKEQADFLKSIGCFYVQGYLYARPMPLADYEALEFGKGREHRLEALKTVKHLSTNDFWDPTSIDTLIFNSYLGGACILEVQNSRIEVLRANDKYVKVIGSAGMTLADALKLDWAARMDPENRARFFAALQHSVETGDEYTDEYVFQDLPGCDYSTYLRVTLRVIATSRDRLLVYCLIENTTALRQSEAKERESERRRKAASDQLELIMNNVSSSITAATIANGIPRILFANEQYYRNLGYSREQYRLEVKNPYDYVHPEDRAGLAAAVNTSNDTRRPMAVSYRALCRDKSVRWMQGNISMIAIPGVDSPVQIGVVSDVTEQHLAEQRERETASQMQAILDNVSSGVAAVVFGEDRQARYIFANSEFYAMFGYTKEQFEQELPHRLQDLIAPEDLPALFRTEAVVRAGSAEPIEYRARRRDGSEIWVLALGSLCTIEGIDAPVHIIVTTDITEQKESAEHFRFLNEAAHEILAQQDTESGILSMLRRLLDFFRGDRVLVYETNDTGDALRNTYEVCAQGIASVHNGMQSITMADTAFWIDAFKKQAYVEVRNFEQHRFEQPTRDYLEANKIDSLVAVPLRRDGRIIGFIGVDNTRQNRAHIGRLVALGDYLAVMLTRRDYAAQLKSHAAQQEQMMQDMPGGYAKMRIAGDIITPVFINDEFCRMCGMTHAQVMTLYSANCYAGLHPEDEKTVRRALRDAIDHRGTVMLRLRFKRGDGGYVPLQGFYRVTDDADGNLYLNGYYSDTAVQDREEQQRRALLDNLPEGAALYAYDGKKLTLIHLNRRYWELVAREPAPDGDTSFLQAVHPGDQAALLAAVDESARTEHDLSCTVRIRYGKNGYRPFRITARVTREENGIHFFYVTYAPITDNNGPTALRDTGCELQTLLDVIPGGVFKYAADAKEEFVYISRNFVERLGYSEAEFRKKFHNCFREMVYAEDRERVAQELHRQEQNDSIGKLEYRIEAANGRLRWFHGESIRIVEPDGKAWYYVTVADITSLRVAESRLRLLTDSISGGLAAFVYNSRSIRDLYVNDGFFRCLGYTREEYFALSEHEPLAVVFEEDRPGIWLSFHMLVHNPGGTESCIYRCHTKDGSCRWFSQRAIIAEKRGDTYVINVVLYDITDQKSIEQQLRRSEEEYRLATLHSNVAIGRYDISTGKLSISPKTIEKFDVPAEMSSVPDGPVEDGSISPDTIPAYEAFFDRIRRGNKEGTATYQRKINGDWKWIEAHFSTLFSDDGQPVSAIISFREVTEQIEQEAVYKKWLQSLQDRPENSYTLFRCNLSKNSAFDTAQGSLLRPPAPLPDSVSFSDRLQSYAAHFVCAEDRGKLLETLSVDALCGGYRRGTHTLALDYRELAPGTGMRWLRLTVELVEFPGSSDIMAYMLFENIDVQKREELATQSHAETDPLTGLLNRTVFRRRVEERLARREGNARCALFMMDVDGFKQVNDRLGHIAGDRALIGIARQLRTVLRREDLICRLGGDEFMAFLCSVPDRETIQKKAERIRAALQSSMDGNIDVTVSLGIAVVPEDGTEFETLYQKADLALYHVKGAGKNRCAFYTADMSACDTTPAR